MVTALEAEVAGRLRWSIAEGQNSVELHLSWLRGVGYGDAVARDSNGRSRRRGESFYVGGLMSAERQ